MKRAYAASKYAKPYERYCREQFPEEAEEIFKGAEVWYQKYMEDMPDLGKNMMAANMTGLRFSPFMRRVVIGWTEKRC